MERIAEKWKKKKNKQWNEIGFQRKKAKTKKYGQCDTCNIGDDFYWTDSNVQSTQIFFIMSTIIVYFLSVVIKRLFL